MVIKEGYESSMREEAIEHCNFDGFHVGHSPRPLSGIGHRSGVFVTYPERQESLIPRVAAVDSLLHHEATEPPVYPAFQILSLLK